MTTTHPTDDLDVRIREAALRLVERDEAAPDRVWNAAAIGVGHAAAPSRRAARRQSLRVALVAAALTIAASGIAVAASADLRDRIFTPDTPTAERMGVFRVSPTIGDGAGSKLPPVPAEGRRMLASMGGSQSFLAQHGTIQMDTARTIFDYHERGADVVAYAARTTKGSICFQWLDHGAGSGGCTMSFFELDRPILASGDGTCTAMGCHSRAVYGLAADEVTAVRVHLADGTTQDAVLGSNAYFWSGKWGRDSWAVDLELELSNGSTTTQPINPDGGGELQGPLDPGAVEEARRDCAAQEITSVSCEQLGILGLRSR